jgi:hypothetical protein
VTFLVTRAAGRLRVVPSDVLPLLRAGRLDGRLADGVERVWLDGLRKTTLDVSVPQIGAPVKPACQAAGAPICGTVCFTDGCTACRTSPRARRRCFATAPASARIPI